MRRQGLLSRPDFVPTGALLDRLTHHVHILEMNGDSYRLRHSRDNAAFQPPHVPDAP